LTPGRLLVLTEAIVVGVGAYWLWWAQQPGLPVPRQVVLSLGAGLGFFLYGLGVGRQRGRLSTGGKIEQAFVTRLIFVSLSLAATCVTVALPSLYFLGLQAVEGFALQTPDLEARLPAGYNGQFVLAILALGAILAVAFAIYSYLDHVNAG
jgi:hypothetical protein